MTQEILNQCTIEGTTVKLPARQFDRSDYLAVKKKLEGIGGKWKGGKTQGFVFEADPTQLLCRIAANEEINLKKDYQFFPTPADIADEMVGYLHLDSGMKVLEPSAGRGALISAIRRKMPGMPVDYCELMPQNRAILANDPYCTLVAEDFLQLDRSEYYDAVLANPPFTGSQDIDHIRKMYEVLKPKGQIMTLASPSWTFGFTKKQREFGQWLRDIEAEPCAVPAGSFKESGTDISTVFLIIYKR